MAEEQQVYDPTSDYLNDIGVRLRDIEEKQNIIKDRVLLIGENLISEKEIMDQEMQELKQGLNKSNEEIKKIKLTIERIAEDMKNLVRKNEFEILQRQFQMFQPLELARISDVEDMINRALRKQK
jgi:predicted nuclease with TOPRIM domain